MRKVRIALLALLILSTTVIYPMPTHNVSAQNNGRVMVIEGSSDAYSKLGAYAANAGLLLLIKPYGNPVVGQLGNSSANGVWMDIRYESGSFLTHRSLDDLSLYNALTFVKSGGRILIEFNSDAAFNSHTTLEKYFGVDVAQEVVLLANGFTFTNAGVLLPEWQGLSVGLRPEWTLGAFFVPANGTTYSLTTVKSVSSGFPRAIAVSGSIGKGQFRILIDTGVLSGDDNIDNYQNKQAVFAMLNWLAAGTPTETPPSQSVSQTTTSQQQTQTGAQIIQGINNDILILSLAIIIAGLAIGIGLSRRSKPRDTVQKDAPK